MSTFTGFSEEDLKRIKTGDIKSDKVSTIRKPKPLFPIAKKKVFQNKSASIIQNHKIDEAIDDLQFDKCRLSMKTTTEIVAENSLLNINTNPELNTEVIKNENAKENQDEKIQTSDICLDNGNANNAIEVIAAPQYCEDVLEAHKAKLEELQLQQRLMEEQNKKRKEMLSKALADRTRQTEEEVLRLEKIKKELQILDGQFSQDVGVLRKKIDLACLTYADAEKHYLKVEKEFLQAKIQLQKEKEKKELLTEHLCALITHNETRKAQKLEILMLELATDKTHTVTGKADSIVVEETDLTSVIIDGVDQRTGKMVEFNGDS